MFEYHQPDGSVRRELRLPEEVFKPESLQSFAQVPVTDDHPPVMLDSKNARQYAVGALDGSVTRDDDHVRSTLCVFDADTIAKMEAGKLDVSCGYNCDLEEKPGVDPVYGKYDAIQRNIIGNHVAVVDHGRAGSARVRMDGAWTHVDEWSEAAREASIEARKGSGGSPDKAKDARVKTGAAMALTAKANKAGTVQAHLQAAKAHGEAAKANRAAGNEQTASAHERQAANHYTASEHLAGHDHMTPAQEFANRRTAYEAAHHGDSDEDGDELAPLQEACQNPNTMKAAPVTVKLDDDSLNAIKVLSQRIDAAKGEDEDADDDEDDSDPDDEGDDANDPDDDEDDKKDEADPDALPAFLKKKSAKKAKCDRRSPQYMNDLKKAQEDLAAATARADKATKDLDEARALAQSEKARADKAEDAVKTARKDADDKFPGAVKARVALETDAALILPATGKDGKRIDRSDLSDRDLRCAVIKHVDSIDIAKEESDDFVRAYYTSALARAKKDAAGTLAGAAALAGARETLETVRADAEKTDASDDDEATAIKNARRRTTTAWAAKEIK